MQLVYARNMTEAVAGALADLGPHDIETAAAGADLNFGRLAQDTGAGATRQVSPVAALPAADPNSLVGALAPLALGAGVVTLTQANLDGVLGDAECTPAQLMSFTLNAHADWDDTVLIAEYYGPEGVEKVERIPVPNGGGVTLYTQLPFSRFHRTVVPAGSGANRTIEIGTDPTRYALSRVGFPGIVVHQMFGEFVSATVDVAQGDDTNIMRRGRIWVVAQAAVVKCNPVYVNMVAAPGVPRGIFRGSPAANYCLLSKAEWFSSQATPGGLAVLELQ